LSSYITV